MKIIAVLGSPHKNGNTSVLARWVLDGAAAQGAEIEEIFLAEKNIEYCRGCISTNNKKMCMSTGNCIIQDDVNSLRNKLYESEGIILASPSYGIMPTARMKNFIVDRIGMYIVYTSGLGNKYFAGISTAGGIGAKKVAHGLVDLFVNGFHQRSFRSGTLYAHVGNVEVKDISGLQLKALKLGERMVKDIRYKRKYLLQKLPNRILNRLLVRRIILKNIYKNKDGQLKAVYQNLIKRKILTR